MMMNSIILLQLLLKLWMTSPDLASGTTYYLYYLGGQSNMDGYGYVDQLPDKLKRPQPDVYIFHGNPAPDNVPVDGSGLWAPLKPGHGVGFTSDGKTNEYSDRFGVELTLAPELKKIHSDGKVAFIKYSRGGTSIDTAAAANFGCWDPDFRGRNGVNQYDHFLATVRMATEPADIDGDGQEDRLVPAGIFWMQGESDATVGAKVAGKYEMHLKRLMDLVRAAFRADDLPVVIGRISDSGQDADGMVWNQGELVREAQARFVHKDCCAALVTTTDNYRYSDKWHYDSEGYLDLGVAFGKAMAEIVQE